jgi:hypothetical protein
MPKERVTDPDDLNIREHGITTLPAANGNIGTANGVTASSSPAIMGRLKRGLVR